MGPDLRSMFPEDEPMWITPEKAEEFLLHNPEGNNRKYRDQRGLEISKAMLDGSFGICQNPIVFDEDGLLLDGQHRLHAIVKSKQPYPFRVVRGVPRESNTFDMGQSRSASDILLIQGEVPPEHATKDQGAIHSIIFWALCDNTGVNPTIAQRKAIIEAMGDAILLAYDICKGKNHKLLRPSPFVAGFSFAILAGVNEETLRELAKQISTGVSASTAAASMREFANPSLYKHRGDRKTRTRFCGYMQECIDCFQRGVRWVKPKDIPGKPSRPAKFIYTDQLIIEGFSIRGIVNKKL